MHVSISRVPSAEDSVLLEAQAWLLLRALAARASSGQPVTCRCGVRLDPANQLQQVALGRGWIDLHPGAAKSFVATLALPPSVEHLFEIFLPLCVGESAADFVVAHVGQSLDGQIATSTGASCFITGHQDLVHTHRLRALFDAIVVGRATVVCDDPRLTTRLVPGPNPARVVLDPRRRSPVDRHVFRDGAAQTLLMCGPSSGGGLSHGQAEVVEVMTAPGDLMEPAEILALLRRRGLRRIFVEGGGVTVSSFLGAGVVDRLHLAISPIILGQGHPGLTLRKIDGLDQALRPKVRRFSLGQDLLFDCEFQPVRSYALVRRT